MSYIRPEPAPTHERATTPNGDDAANRQWHDRIQVEEQETSTMAGTQNTEISVGQRMISATLGSVLTSLLGKLCCLRKHL
jgi:hypothetical protein